MAYSMNKAELIDSMASGADISKADAKKALDAFIDTTSAALKKGDRVALVGFGSFSASKRTARAKRKIDFRPGKSFSSSVFMTFAKSYIDKATPLMMRILKNNGMALNPIKMSAMLKSGLKNSLSYRGNDPLLRKRPGRVKYSNITLKRGVVTGNNIGQNLRLTARHQELLNTLIKGTLNSLLNFMETIAILKSDVDLTGAKLTKKQILKAIKIGIEEDGLNRRRPIGIDEDGLNKIYNSIFSSMMSALNNGEKVSIPGFGTFSLIKNAARTGRNPQTGKEIKIAAKKVAKFKAGKALADTVN